MVSRTPMGVIATRPTTSSIFRKTPSGAEPFGIDARASCSAVIFSPRGISALATTTFPRSFVNACTFDRYRVINITPTRPQITAPVSAIMRRLFRMTEFSITEVSCGGFKGASGAKQKKGNDAPKTERHRIRQRVTAVDRNFEARNSLAGQEAIKKLRDCNDCRQGAARVDHLANRNDPSRHRDDAQRRQHYRDAIHRSDCGKQLAVAGAHRAKRM